MKKIIFVVLVTFTLFSVKGACKIELSSIPTLPAKNLIENPNFKQGLNSWKLFGGGKGEAIIDEKTNLSFLQIIGDKNKSIGVYQHAYLKEPYQEGATVFCNVKTNFIGTDIEMKKPSLSLKVHYTDGTFLNLRPPPVPFEPHQWTNSANAFVAKKAIKAFTIHACYYNQIGKSRWTDFVLKIGKVKLSVKVFGDEFKQVKIYSALEGLIFDSGELASGSTSFTKDIEVGVGCGYYVEVTDTDGKIHGKRYPENANAPMKDTADSIPVFSRFNAEKIMPLKKEGFSFTLPKIDDKKVYLCLKARLDISSSRRVAGYTGAMALLLNNKEIVSECIVDRKQTFTRVDGSIMEIFSSGGFVVFYSPWYFGLSEDNNFCPIDIPDNNPFNFKFDISDLVKKGENILEIKNILNNRKELVSLWCADCRIELKNK